MAEKVVSDPEKKVVDESKKVLPEEGENPKPAGNKPVESLKQNDGANSLPEQLKNAPEKSSEDPGMKQVDKGRKVDGGAKAEESKMVSEKMDKAAGKEGDKGMKPATDESMEMVEQAKKLAPENKPAEDAANQGDEAKKVEEGKKGNEGAKAEDAKKVPDEKDGASGRKDDEGSKRPPVDGKKGSEPETKASDGVAKKVNEGKTSASGGLSEKSSKPDKGVTAIGVTMKLGGAGVDTVTCEAQDPPKRRPIGTRFLKHSQWFAMCPVHANYCMELEELIDPEAELRKHVRPGGPLEMVRYALLNEGIPVCADYPDWRYHPELSLVRSSNIPTYRRIRLVRWLSEVCPIQPLEHYYHFLLRCYDVATRELKSTSNEQDTLEAYEAEFPHILDKWVARLHFGCVLRRRHTGKSRNRPELQLILELLREDCEILFHKGKLLLYDRPSELQPHQNPPPQLWPLQMQQSEFKSASKLNPLDEMCGSTSLI